MSLTGQASGHLNINKLKTATSLFSLSTSKDKVKLKLDDHSVPQVETPTCLGATRDSRLTLTSNIEAAEKTAYTKLSLKRSWQEQAGGNGKFLRQVYTGAVHPIAEYASFSWITASKPRKGKLDKIQNAGLTIILGAKKTTPIREKKNTTDLELLEARREYKAPAQAEKVKRLPSNPLHKKLQSLTKYNRLKRQNLNHIVKSLKNSRRFWTRWRDT